MAFTLYITKSSINDLKRIFIEPEDWAEVVANDPSLSWVEDCKTLSEGFRNSFPSRTAAIWWPEGKFKEEEGLVFELEYDGRMGFGYRKYVPNDPYLRKIVEVAEKLQGFVQGEDGEILTLDQ